LEQVISDCKSVYPNEACGLLAGRKNIAEKIYKMTNIEHSSVSYMMDPGEQFRALKEMRKHGDQMVTIYHSHPHSPAYPSPKDISLAYYPDPVYLIVGLSDIERPEVRAFEILDGKVREVRIESFVDAPVSDRLK
jgi:proteasome lid subunit RPN8/RPN11